MGEVLFNDNWRFAKTPLGVTISDADESKLQYVPVCLPHDWAIEDVEHLYQDACGWYRKNVTYHKEERGDLKVLLRFEGVYMDCTVYINDSPAGEWKYGYSSFDLEISDFLREGDNVLTVQVNYQNPNSRWYSGAGIYRNVWWKECDECYLPYDSTYIATELISCSKGGRNQSDTEKGDFYADITTRIEGTPEVMTGAYCIYTLERDDSWVMPLAHSPVREKGGSYYNIVRPKLQGMFMWDIDHTALYKLRVDLYAGPDARLMDSQTTTFGFRTIRFKGDTGLWWNNHPLKVHGVCEHHDLGCLGVAFSKAAMKRKLRLLREMGVNAIRTSHNMPAPEVMELADEMGFLIISEAFDMWEKPKTTYDYARFFTEWVERDVTSWVRRDRNHPSLLLWSIGNEIYDTHEGPRGLELVKQLSRWVRREDPAGNAEITLGSNYMPWENTQKCADVLGIAGYNYGEAYYDAHHQAHPDWIIYGSETASVTQSRRVYHFPLRQPTLADEDEQCSSLGNSNTSWGAESIRACIEDDLKRDFCFGQFIWTGFDYIGEPTPYQTKNSYFGQLDTAGFPKDAYYLFKAAWTDAEKHPMIHLFPYWDFNEGQLIDVTACTNGAGVELFVNGESQGKSGKREYPWQLAIGTWQVPYHKGVIRGVAYDENGFWMAETQWTTPGEPKILTVKQEAYDSTFDQIPPLHRSGTHKSRQQRSHPQFLTEPLYADGESLCFLHIGINDEEDIPVPNAENYVKVTVKGEGVLLGLDNGDSTDYDPYHTNVRKLFKGKLLAVIGATTTAGSISVIVEGEGLTTASITLESIPRSFRPGIGQRAGVPDRELPRIQPLRKIALQAEDPITPLRTGEGILLLNKEQPSLLIGATLYPAQAAVDEITWKAVNQKGIEVNYATVILQAVIEGEHNRTSVASHSQILLTAFGDGDFRLRCSVKGGKWKTVTFSELEVRAEGFGKKNIDPYTFVSAGLFTDSIGEIGNGNEKGISSDRFHESGVVFAGLDFGSYGSDTLTISVFALTDGSCPIEIWLGNPKEQGSEKLAEVIYTKPMKWNVYQEETFTLPKRVNGLTTLSFVLHQKVHIKGFSFQKQSKAFGRISAGEYTQIYGDSYRIDTDAITSIGNNVTITYEDMDFVDVKVQSLTIWGRSPLPSNTIHLLFTPDKGEPVRTAVEFISSQPWESSDYEPPVYQAQTFTIPKLTGSGSLTFVFLPGSNFDFHSFRLIP
jgi:beta-galactosidase